MLPVCCSPMAITLAVTKDISLSPLAALLALQRAEEPHTPVHLHELPLSDLYPGLNRGRYNAAIVLQSDAIPGWASESLWQDELVIALPTRSPLLVGAEITVAMLLPYKVWLWPPCVRPALRGPIAQLVTVENAGYGSGVSTFELMAALVAAGYYVGIAPRSRIMQARGWGIVMRPLAGGPYRLTTKLLRARQDCPSAVERFAERARRIAVDRPQGRVGVAGWM